MLVSDGDPAKLVERFVQYLTLLSGTAAALTHEKFQYVYDQLETLKSAEGDDDSLHRLTLLKIGLDQFIDTLPVIGFNSGRYDLPIIRQYIFGELAKIDTIDYIIKRNNQFLSVKTPHLLWLDISNYLAPGFSYSDFLAAYGVKEQKGYFPYEYFDSLSRLEETSLPPHEAFHSSLKTFHRRSMPSVNLFGRKNKCVPLKTF